MRLDVLLADQYPEYSRSLLQKLIREGRVKVNGYCLKKASIDVPEGVEIVLDTTNLDKPKAAIDIEVLFEDKNVVVANKPIGILSHSKGAYNPETALADWLKLRDGYDFPEDNDRGGIVHRLDRPTSGVIICAKTPPAAAYLQKQFSDRKTKKTYLAVVSGVPKEPEAIIDMPIERNPKAPASFRVGPNGKLAKTQYKVLRYNEAENRCLIELQPETGRTHQLRVHLKHLGLPIEGDELYGGKPAKRMMLHAFKLELDLPDGQHKVFTAPEPQEFAV